MKWSLAQQEAGRQHSHSDPYHTGFDPYCTRSEIGIVVLEPKSDLIRDVEKLADKLGIPKSKIKVVDPTDLVKSVRFNPLAGPLEVAAETWRGTLDALTGDQDPFFKDQQGERRLRM